MNFAKLTNENLIDSTRRAVKVESAAATNVVRHFVEIYQRDLYLERGFSSMFLMATEEFGYDKASAQRRVNAMLLALEVPEILSKIDSGRLCLQSAADIQTFLNGERGRRNPYSRAQIEELVDVCSGLSTREVQLELVSRNPQLDFRESKKMVSKDRMQITYTTSVKTEEKLRRIKELRSHATPFMNREELMDYMAEIVLDKIDPVRRDQRAGEREEKKAAPTHWRAARENKAWTQSADDGGTCNELEHERLLLKEEIVSDAGEIQVAFEFVASPTVPAQELARRRYIKVSDQRRVRRSNENHGCEFVDQASGRKCGSKHQLQFDHVEEFSCGGSNDAENLRILCAKHNRFWWSRSSSFVRAPWLAYG